MNEGGQYKHQFISDIGIRGQITIYVIVGIVIVVGIVISLYLVGGPRLLGSTRSSPDIFIQSCAREVVQDSLEKIYRNGGETEISFGMKFNNIEYNYLCHNWDYYLACYNLHPLLEKQIENEIREDTRDIIQGCFDELIEDLEDKGFKVVVGATSYSVDLLPGSVDIKLKRDLKITKSDSSQTYSEFDLRIIDPIYRLVKTTERIVNSESSTCRFDRNEYMLFYPDYDIDVINYENNKIYIIRDRLSGKEFKFAVRTCAIPLGV